MSLWDIGKYALFGADPFAATAMTLSDLSEDELWGNKGDKIDYQRNAYQTDLANYQMDPQMAAMLKIKLKAAMDGRGGIPQEQMAQAMQRAQSGAQAMNLNQGGINAGTARRMAGNQYGQARGQMAMANEGIKAQQQMQAEQMMKQLLAQEHRARLERQKTQQGQFAAEESRMMTKEKDWAERSRQEDAGKLGQIANIGSQYLAN